VDAWLDNGGAGSGGWHVERKKESMDVVMRKESRDERLSLSFFLPSGDHVSSCSFVQTKPGNYQRVTVYGMHHGHQLAETGEALLLGCRFLLET
jgi:hypothetical protein